MRLDALGFGNVMANDVKSLPSPKLSEATQQYIKLRGMRKAKTFHQTATRNSSVIIEILGDRNLQEYSTVDAGKVRDTLIEQGLNILSVKRTLITSRAIINLAIAENGLDMRNPFASVYMPEGDIKKRVSIPINTIREIQHACYRSDNDMR
jgi:hypothetical protein